MVHQDRDLRRRFIHESAADPRSGERPQSRSAHIERGVRVGGPLDVAAPVIQFVLQDTHGRRDSRQGDIARAAPAQAVDAAMVRFGQILHRHAGRVQRRAAVIDPAGQEPFALRARMGIRMGAGSRRGIGTVGAVFVVPVEEDHPESTLPRGKRLGVQTHQDAPLLLLPRRLRHTGATRHAAGQQQGGSEQYAYV